MHTLIVGGGQGGLTLALGLLQHGHEVTVITDRTASEVEDGRIMSTQAMFARALAIEHNLGLDFWSDAAPRIDRLSVSVAGGGTSPAISWTGRLSQPGASVDQRLKFSRFMNLVAARGGRFVINGVTVSDLDDLHRLGRYDLIIVAAGKGELAGLFERDIARSPFSTPQRALSAVYLDGVAADRGDSETGAVRCSMIPQVGEVFTIPAYASRGPCDIVLIEGVPGGPLDCFQDVRRDPRAHLDRTLQVMAQYVPWEYDRCREAGLTDANAHLVGRYAPKVCHPVATLPSGGLVLGLADVLVLNDPVSGQGANGATVAAGVYIRSIVERAEAGLPYDRAWMQATFDRYWAHAESVTAWTNALLRPPPQLLQLVGAAVSDQRLADRFADTFAHPSDVGWILDPAVAAADLAEIADVE
jgi:hypothetical protein